MAAKIKPTDEFEHSFPVCKFVQCEMVGKYHMQSRFAVQNWHEETTC